MSMTPKIKICGITNLQDASIAEANGADYLGFVFAKNSPRCVTSETAKNIIKNLQHIETVGVFVEQTDTEIEHIMHNCNLDFAQVYRPVKMPNIKIIYGIALPETVPHQIQADFVLYDTYDKNQKGGTGKTFDWTLLPEDLSKAFVAGGIQEKNVENLIEQYHPYGIDLSSSIETYPGKKDIQKLIRFLKIAKRQ